VIYILSILFTIAFVYYSKWQFINGRAGKWHTYGFLMRALAVVTPFIMQRYPAEWRDYLLAGTINILLWELLINKIALNVDWFHIGRTSFLDKTLGKTKWWIYTISVITALLARLL
jgi:hypothetical protein